MWLGPQTRGDWIPKVDSHASNVILNNQYEEIQRVGNPNGKMLDYHEFSVGANGSIALRTMVWQEEKYASDIEQGTRRLLNGGFQELNLTTGQSMWEWNALANNITLSESMDVVGMAREYSSDAW